MYFILIKKRILISHITQYMCYMSRYLLPNLEYFFCGCDLATIRQEKCLEVYLGLL